MTGHGTTETIIEGSPFAAQPASTGGARLTAHAIYERDAPGVVFVRAQIIQQVQDPFDLFPQQERSISTGSGFLIDTAGDILTNYHVIEGANRSNGVTVQFEDNVTRTAAVVDQDPNNDLALLKVNIAGVPEVAPARARRLDDRPGRRPDACDRQPVRARPDAHQRDRVGAPAPDPGAERLQHRQRHPDRRSDQPRQLRRPAARRGRARDRDQLPDRDRRRAADRAASGSAFAIPINTAKEFIPRLKHDGKVEIADLGATGDAPPRARSTASTIRSVAGRQPGGRRRPRSRGDVIVSVAGSTASQHGAT